MSYLRDISSTLSQQAQRAVFALAIILPETVTPVWVTSTFIFFCSFRFCLCNWYFITFAFAISSYYYFLELNLWGTPVAACWEAAAALWTGAVLWAVRCRTVRAQPKSVSPTQGMPPTEGRICLTSVAILGQTLLCCFLGLKILLQAEVKVLCYNEGLEKNIHCFYKMFTNLSYGANLEWFWIYHPCLVLLYY